jgi:hypothetical protein
VILPAAIERVAIARPKAGAGDKPLKETAIVALADGTLAAIDLTKGQLRGRLRLGRFLSLEASSEVVLGLEEAGALLVIDGTRDLLPEPVARVNQVRAPGRQRTSP